MMAQQKRTAEEAESLLVGVKAIVFDVEGTTTPITFTKDTLEPCIRDNIEKYLKEKFEDAETIKAVSALRELAKKDKEEGKEGAVEVPDACACKEDVIKASVASVLWQMNQGHKSTELQQLQCCVLRQAYESGDLKGEVFEDVPPMMRMLSEEGFNLYVFSSGNVESEKLLFANTSDGGDITDVFAGFFDASIGPKTDPESFKKIASEIKVRAQEILFLSDTPEEAEAAVNAGWKSALVIRPGNADLTDEHLHCFACIEQLDELYGDEDEDDPDVKRLHGDDNGEPDDDDEDDENEDELDEDDEGEEDEGEDA